VWCCEESVGKKKWFPDKGLYDSLPLSSGQNCESQKKKR
jgi:hypothetical protein